MLRRAEGTMALGRRVGSSGRRGVASEASVRQSSPSDQPVAGTEPGDVLGSRGAEPGLCAPRSWTDAVSCRSVPDL